MYLFIQLLGESTGEHCGLVGLAEEGGAGAVPAGHRGREVGEAAVPGPHPDHGLAWRHGA